MFDFGWVRIHLEDVFLESIQVLFLFLLRFLVRGMKSEQSGHFRGPTPRHREPHATAWVHDMAWHVHAVAWHAHAVPWHVHATAWPSERQVKLIIQESLEHFD